MSYRDIVKILGYNFLILAALFVVPILVSLYYLFIVPESHPQPHDTIAFIESFAVTAALGLLCLFLGKNAFGHLYKKEAVTIVVLIWFITPAITALPFIFSGTLTNPFQAYFETTSGLTTTGASVLEGKKYDADLHEIPISRTVAKIQKTYTFYGNVKPVRNGSGEILHEGIEAVGKALLFWRSFIQWMGGLGIIVLFIAIFPMLGLSAKFLYQAEITGPLKGSLEPRVARAALQLWIIYTGLTLLQTVLLKITNSKMEWFDAITIPLSTLATGGFSVRNAGIGYYDNVYTEAITAIFMVLGATNFTIFYYAFRAKIYRINKSELYLFLALIFITCSLSAWFLIGKEKVLLTNGGESSGVFNVGESVRYAFFQVISAFTSTGFSTANYDIWPQTIQTIMVIVMFIGGMSGSTAGGIKIIRHYIFFHVARFRAESLFRTEPIRQIRIGDQEIETGTISNVLCLMGLWILLSTVGTFLYISSGIDAETSLGLTACMVNNVGLAFRVAGPLGSCAFLSDFELVLSSLLMILGRLEFFAVLAMLVPAFWKSN